MTDVNGILQVEMCRQCRKIVRIMIHVMPVGNLRRPSMAAAIMSNDPIAVVEEEHHLRVPVIARQWPAMAEHDRLTFAPVFEKNPCTIFHRNHVHEILLWVLVRGYGIEDCR